MKRPAVRVLLDPLVDENPVARQVLGICSALAVTTSLIPSLTMAAALAFVVTASSGIVSAIRRLVPASVRLIVQVTIIATLVIVVDQVLQVHAPATSKRLSIFVSLIVTNCIVLGRAEGFAMRNGIAASLLDGLGNGLGYGLVLVVLGGARELLGSGRLLGARVLPLASEGGWFEPHRLAVSPPGAFLLLGGLIWLIRTMRPPPSAGSPGSAGGAGTGGSHA